MQLYDKDLLSVQKSESWLKRQKRPRKSWQAKASRKLTGSSELLPRQV